MEAGMEATVQELVDAKDSGKLTGAAKEERIKEVLLEIDDASNELKPAAAEYLRGRVLSLREPLDPQCESRLTKSVKLNPNNIAAWNLLGEVFWRKGNLYESMRCFEAALQREQNTESLRNLSMLLRQRHADTKAERMRHVEQSIQLAKKALSLDLECGRSWFVLGNAYLTLFFSLSQQEEHLQQSLKAFNRALRDEREAEHNPDLHHNRGTLLKYIEDFPGALAALRKAEALDPGLALSKQLHASLVAHVQTVDGAVRRKGSIKSKRLQHFRAELDKTAQHQQQSTTGRSKATAASSSAPSSSPPSMADACCCCLDDLAPGADENTGKVLLLKVVTTLTREPMPQLFLVMDRRGAFGCLSVYNAKDHVIRNGDVLQVDSPTRRDVTFQDDPELGTLSYISIRVEVPTSITRNGQQLGRDALLNAHLSLHNKS